MTKKELMQKMEALGNITEEQRNAIVCSLIGHSRIQEYCFGYYTCARCGAQVGDSLAGYYSAAEETVIVGHNCSTCQKNYKKLGWKDKIFCPNPFVAPKGIDE